MNTKSVSRSVFSTVVVVGNVASVPQPEIRAYAENAANLHSYLDSRVRYTDDFSGDEVLTDATVIFWTD